MSQVFLSLYFAFLLCFSIYFPNFLFFFLLFGLFSEMQRETGVVRERERKKRKFLLENVFAAIFTNLNSPHPLLNALFLASQVHFLGKIFFFVHHTHSHHQKKNFLFFSPSFMLLVFRARKMFTFDFYFFWDGKCFRDTLGIFFLLFLCFSCHRFLFFYFILGR